MRRMVWHRACVALLLWLGVGSVAAAAPEILDVPMPDAPNVQVWHAPVHRVPVLSLQLQFDRAGFAYDPADKQGLAHMSAAMLSEGAGSRDARAFQEALDDHAIQFGASVDEDVLSVHVTTLREHAPTAIALMTEALTTPRVDADAVARVQRAMVASLKRMEEDPGYIASRAWRKAAYAGHPYAQLRRGTLETVPTITPDDIHAFLQAHVRRSVVRVAVSGDASVAELQQWLAPLLRALPAAAVDVAAVPAVVPPAKQPLVQRAMQVPQTQIMFSTPAIPRSDPRYFSLLILNQIMGGDALASRLSKRLRDQHGLTYGAGSSVDGNAAITQWVGSFSTRNEKAALAVQLLREELAKVAAQGIDAKELQDAKQYLLGSVAIQLDGTLAVADFLATLQRYGLGRDYFATRASRIAAVTRESVQALANALFVDQPLLLVAVGAPNPPIPE